MRPSVQKKNIIRSFTTPLMNFKHVVMCFVYQQCKIYRNEKIYTYRHLQVYIQSKPIGSRRGIQISLSETEVAFR